jgi:hypothetical protein
MAITFSGVTITGGWNILGSDGPSVTPTVEYLVVAGGGGGGGGSGGSTGVGQAGGSGIVIIRYSDIYPTAISTTGSPTVANTGGYRIYTWTSSGTITF